MHCRTHTGYHGVLAPNAAWRAAVVPPAAADDDLPPDEEHAGPPHCRCRHIAWATLLRRVFEIDVLACPRCGGRMRVLATLEAPTVVQKILTHLGLPAAPVTPRAPPALPATLWEPA